MGKATFDLISNIMRYWFAGLIILIVVRLFFSVIKQSSKESSVAKKQTKHYQMGLLEIIGPRENQKLYGQRFALRRENTIGRSNQCDIQIQERSIRPVQAMIFQKGNQVFIRAMENKIGVYLNGERIEGDIPLLDGDEIELSNLLFRLSLQGKLGKQSPRKKEESSPWSNLAEEDFYDEEDIWDEEENWDDEDEGWDEDEDDQLWNEYDDDEDDVWEDEEEDWDDDDDPHQRSFRR